MVNPLRNSSDVIMAAYPSLGLGPPNHIQEVLVTGSAGFLQGNKMKSNLSVPADLCQSAEPVKVIELADKLIDFEEKVLNLLDSESRVLVIVNHKSKD